MPRKAAQLQIRVTAAQKARLKQLARRAGQDVSAYVLARALPDRQVWFDSVVESLRDESHRRFALAELSDVLAALGPAELERTVERATLTGLSALTANYLAATVEHLCAANGIAAPAWTRDVRPLDEPWFATELKSLRVHLLVSSPIAFRRRNLFIDAGPDARV